MISSLVPVQPVSDPVQDRAGAALSFATPSFATLGPPGAAAVSTPSSAGADGRSASDQAAQDAEAPAPAQSSVRLMIEQTEGEGFVYRLVDSLTGKTLSEIPQTQVADMGEDALYAAGAVVSTTA